MPFLHPHPKNLFAFTPCPLCSASATRPLPLLLVVALHLSMCKIQVNRWGAQSMGLRPLYHHHYHLFGEMGKGRPCPVTALVTRAVFAPPHPLLSDPHRVDPYPWHTRTRIGVHFSRWHLLCHLGSRLYHPPGGDYIHLYIILEFNLITFTSGLHLIIFSNLIWEM